MDPSVPVPKPLWKRAGFVLSVLALGTTFYGLVTGRIEGRDFVWVAGIVAGGQHAVNWRERRDPYPQHSAGADFYYR